MPFLLYFFERRNRRRGNRSFCHTFNFFDSAGLFQSKLTHFFNALSPALDKDPFPGGFLTSSSGLFPELCVRVGGLNVPTLLTSATQTKTRRPCRRHSAP